MKNPTSGKNIFSTADEKKVFLRFLSLEKYFIELPLK